LHQNRGLAVVHFRGHHSYRVAADIDGRVSGHPFLFSSWALQEGERTDVKGKYAEHNDSCNFLQGFRLKALADLLVIIRPKWLAISEEQSNKANARE
jgi:hypothetical protein